MAKKPDTIFSITKAAASKLTRSEQGRYAALGYLEGADVVSDSEDGGSQGSGSGARRHVKGDKPK